MSIRIQLLALVLAVMLPAAGLVGYNMVEASNEARQAAYGQVRVVAQEVAARFDLVLRDHEALLARLAERPRIKALDPANCDPIIAEFASVRPEYTTLGLRDRDANAVCTFLRPPLGAERVRAYPWFDAGLRHGQFVVGDAFLGPQSRRWVLPLTHPVTDAAGNVAGLLLMTLDLAALQQRVFGTLPEETVVVVFDRGNKYLMRSIQPAEWIGKPLPRAQLDRLPDRIEEVFELSGVDGVTRLNAGALVAASDWRVYAGLPKDLVLAAHEARLARSVAVGIVVLLLVLGIAYRIGSAIAKPIGELARSAAALAPGGSPARASGKAAAEIEAAAGGLQRLAEEREQQRGERAALAAHYDQLIRMARDIVLLIDPAGTIVEANDVAVSAYGYGADELRGMQVRALYPPQAQAAAEQNWQDSARAQGVLFETVHRRKDGSTFPVEISARAIEVAGKLYRQSFVRDISERKQAEAARRTAEAGTLRAYERFEKVFLGAPEAMSISEMESGRLIAVNDAFCATFGRAREELIGRSSLELGLWTDASRRDATLAALAAGQAVRGVEGQTRRRSGELRDVLYSAETIESGGDPCLLLMFTDVTERKRAEQALRESEQRFRLATATGNVWDWNLRTNRTSYPEGTWSDLGYDARDADNPLALFESILHPEDLPRWRQAIRDHIRRRLPYDLDYRARTKSGEYRWFNTKGQAQWDESGRATYMAGTTFDITERKRAEQAQRESETRLRNVFEQANDGIYVISAENRYLEANARGLELLGYTRDELLQMGVADVLAPHEVARLAVEPPRMMSGVPHFAEWEHVRKDGTTFPGEVSARRLDERSYLAIVRDLTERKRAEEERGQIFERITDAFVALDKDWRYTFVNPKAAQMFGRRAEDLIGKHIWTEFPEGVGQPFHLAYEKAMAEQQPAFLEEYYPPFDRWFENRVYPSPEGLSIYFHDITSRKQAEAALESRAVELAALNRLGRQVNASLKLAQVAQSVLDESMRAVAPDLALLFLREGSELRLLASATQGAAIGHATTPVHRVGECLCGRAAAQGRAVYSRDIHADPRCTWNECKQAGVRSFAALPLHSGDTVIGVLGLASASERDFESRATFLETFAEQVTAGLQNARMHSQIERHATELEQRVAERTAQFEAAKIRAEAADRVKSTFLATMSHELRTPLNSIIGFTGILLQKLPGPLNAEQEKQLGIVRNASRHLLALINDVLDISKVEAGELSLSREAFDLRALLERLGAAFAPQAARRGLGFSLDIGQSEAGVTGDARRVEQVLNNLLSNALKFTPEGKITLTLAREGGAFVIAVADTGVGIKSGDMGKLFRPFSQIETGLLELREGTGLGLAISLHLAQAMGGQIAAESAWGKGSRFSFTLPAGGKA